MSENKPVNLSRTICISLFTSVFYTAVGLIAVPSATSNNIFRQYLAQNPETTTPESSETNSTSDSNTEATTTEKPATEVRPANTLEKAIIAELNRARTDPQGYAAWLETQKQYYQGMLLKLPGEQPIRTNRGLRSLEEAIAFLRKQNQLPPLSSSTALVSTAKQQITAISNDRTINNENNLVYNKVTPEAIVMQLVVDDGFPERPHRLAIFSQSHQNAGIACSKIPVYNNICAIAYQAETTDIAQQPTESKPSSNTPNTTASTTKPETGTESASATSVTDNSDRNSRNSNSGNNSDRLPTPPGVGTSIIPQPEEEVIINTESSSNANRETAKTETNSSTPTTESSTPETESESATTETETNSATTPATESNTPETESESATTETETNSATTPATESSNPESETKLETNSEVATNSETNNTSEAVEIVEAGILQEGDETIPNDGSFYDSFPLEGSAGDSFTITLESSEFDTFLAIMDEDGNIIEQNDDISEEDSNSRLEITLPGNGTYSIIVNAYDKGGKGNYVLKVAR
jgi:hypothetical protein